MRIFTSPIVAIFFALVQIFAGLSLTGILPGFDGSPNAFSWIFGGVLIVSGLVQIVDKFSSRNKEINVSMLTEEDSMSIKELVENGKRVEAITHVRKKTGLSLKEASDYVKSLS